MFKYEGKKSLYIVGSGMREEAEKQPENQILQTLAIYRVPTKWECITNKNRQRSELLNILSRYAREKPLHFL